MNRSTQSHLAFNIHDAGPARLYTGSDAAGLAKGKIAQTEHGQAIDLPDDFM